MSLICFVCSAAVASGHFRMLLFNSCFFYRLKNSCIAAIFLQDVIPYDVMMYVVGYIYQTLVLFTFTRQNFAVCCYIHQISPAAHTNVTDITGSLSNSRHTHN